MTSACLERYGISALFQHWITPINNSIVKWFYVSMFPHTSDSDKLLNTTNSYIYTNYQHHHIQTVVPVPYIQPPSSMLFQYLIPCYTNKYVNFCVTKLIFLDSSSSCRIIKLSSSITLCMLELYHWTLEGRPRCRGVHCNMWDVFSVARPHSHVVSPLKYPHFFLCSLLRIRIRNSLF